MSMIYDKFILDELQYLIHKLAFLGLNESQSFFESIDLTDTVFDNLIGHVSPEAQSEQDLLAEIEVVREKESTKLSSDLCVLVRRDMVFDDLLSIYQKRNTVSSVLKIQFVDEDGVGDGVTKDAYSAFFEAVYEKFDGFFAKVPLSTSLEEGELVLIGKIINHAFVTYGIFPIQISACGLTYYMFGEATDEEIVEGFLKYLPSKESELMMQFKANGKGNVSAIGDIFSELHLFQKPTMENIEKLLVKAGKMALLRNTCFAFQNLVMEMGTFWRKLSKSHLLSIFNATRPNAEKIIDSLDCSERNRQEGRIIIWLHRYIRSCTQTEMERFLRFITGSTSISPATMIKVEFNDQTIENLRPRSQTCFQIFIIPRQYFSFTQMKTNLDFFIGNASNWALHDE